MTDLEKVIKGLECCRHGFCFACPYNDGIDENVECKQKWADDALSLLKEQAPVKPIIKHSTDGFDDVAYCGKCGARIGRLKQNCCPNCGRKVAWNG